MKQIDYVAVIEGQPVRRAYHERMRETGIVARKTPTPAILEALGLEPLYLADKPALDAGETAERNATPEQVGGEWVLGWTVRAETAQELADAKVRRHAELANRYSAAMSVISSAYPPEEREGWAEQVAAAQAVLDGGTSALIDALRAGTGETAADMATTIMTKRAQYRALYGAATGNRRALDTQIEAATTIAEVAAVDLETGWPA